MTDDVVTLPERRTRGRAWLAWSGWSLLVVIEAFALTAQIGLPFRYALASAAINVYALALVAWGACRVVSRLELWRRRSIRAVACAHVVLAVVALACWAIAQLVFMRATVGPDFWAVVFENSWMFQLLTAAAMYAASVGLALTIQAMDRESARARRQAQLELTARQGELTALKAQIQPHFLLNSLNSVVSLLDQSPEEARAMLLRLGSLLQSTFERMELPEVPLRRELDTIHDYLEVERVRFGDRLAFGIDASPAAADLPVPPFILQPLVENAVKHAIERRPEGGRIDVGAGVANGVLELTVRDSGNGFTPGSGRNGRGIDLTERRLAAIYGGGARLLFSNDGRGFVARVTVPVSHER